MVEFQRVGLGAEGEAEGRVGEWGGPQDVFFTVFRLRPSLVGCHTCTLAVCPPELRLAVIG